MCHIIPAFYVLGATAVALVIWPGRQRLRWFLPTGPVAGLLAAWWVIPFAGRHAYVNDMGWEPLPHTTGGDTRTVWAYLDGPGRAVAVLLVAGAGTLRLMFSTVLPNCMAPLIVTQFGLDAESVLAWLKDLRQRGIDPVGLLRHQGAQLADRLVDRRYSRPGRGQLHARHSSRAEGAV